MASLKLRTIPCDSCGEFASLVLLIDPDYLICSACAKRFYGILITFEVEKEQAPVSGQPIVLGETKFG